MLNKSLVSAVLAALAALLTTTGILPQEISNAHIAEAATLIMALAATYLHAHGAGQNAGSSDAVSAARDAAIKAAEHAAGEIVHAAVAALEAQAAAPAAPAESKPAA